jgi:hypothetical protein
MISDPRNPVVGTRLVREWNGEFLNSVRQAQFKEAATVVRRVGTEQSLPFRLQIVDRHPLQRGHPREHRRVPLLVLARPRRSVLNGRSCIPHHCPPTRQRGSRPRPLFGGEKSPAAADKELDCRARRRMGPAAKVSAISARRSAALMRLGDKGFGPAWVSYMETVRDQWMIG